MVLGMLSRLPARGIGAVTGFLGTFGAAFGMFDPLFMFLTSNAGTLFTSVTLLPFLVTKADAIASGEASVLTYVVFAVGALFFVTVVWRLGKRAGRRF